MPLFKYIGHYGHFIEGIGAVVEGDVVELLEKLPGYDWIAHEESHSPETPPGAPQTNAEPVSAPAASNETPAPPIAPEALIGPPGKGHVPASVSVAAVVH